MNSLVLEADWNPKPSYEPTPGETQTKRARNASATWQEPELRLINEDRPVPSDDEVLVRVRYVGICGSDLSMTATDEDGYMHYPAYARFPNVIGHEFAGVVVETGAKVSMFKPGDPVTAEVTDYCMQCEMCRRGSPGHCENFEQLGFTVPGAFAEFTSVPEKILWDVSSLERVYDDEDEMLMAAATIEPTTISYNGLFVRAEGIRPGDYYVFHGIGPIGLTGMNVARAAGAGKVIGLDPVQERLEIARKLGFEYVYDPTSVNPADAILAETNGRGADVHVETAGSVEQTYPVIEATLAEGANVVHISNAKPPAPVTMRQYQGNAAQVYGSEGHTGDRIYPLVIRLMAAGHLDNLPIVTSVYQLSEAPEAIERARQRVDGKVMIEV